MKTINKCKALLGLCALVAFNSCQAQDTAVFFVDSTKPTRIVYTLRFLEIRDRTPTLHALMRSKNGGDDYRKALEEDKRVEARIVAIHEHPNAPESLDMDVEIICKPPGQYRIQSAHAMLRDGEEQLTQQDWRPIPEADSPWPMAAAAVACRREQILQAATLTQGKADAAFAQLGLLYIGNKNRLETVDFIWKTLLVDGTRPAYKEKEMSDPERAQALAKLDANLARAKAQLKADLAMAEASLGDQQGERAFKTQLAKRRQAAHEHMKWVIGLSEQELMSSAGPPASTLGDEVDRVLVYQNTYDLPGVGYTLDGNGQRLGTSTRVTCEVQITFTQGGSVRERRAMSYRLLASNGGCRDLRWLNRLSK
jgi:hypothetical protein